MKLPVIQNTKLWLGISLSLILASVLLIISVGLKTGIDFTGGSLLEVRYDNSQRPTQDQVVSVMNEVGIPVILSTVGENGFSLRMKDLSEDDHQKVISKLTTLVVADGKLTEVRFDSIGPVVGKELTTKSIQAILLVLLAIMLFVAYSFRKVSFPVKSWKYGVIAIVALFHDIVITIGCFVVAGMVWGWETNTAFIAALLTVLGYSVNDTIVVFDRIRENLHRRSGTFEEVVEMSVQETMARSIATSMTTVAALLAVAIFGGESIRPFAVTLMTGIFFGTYSSIFIASPLLVLLQKFSNRIK